MRAPLMREDVAIERTRDVENILCRYLSDDTRRARGSSKEMSAARQQCDAARCVPPLSARRARYLDVIYAAMIVSACCSLMPLRHI